MPEVRFSARALNPVTRPATARDDARLLRRVGIATSDIAVAVIADRVGYESEAAFSRAFKRGLGRAPSEWLATAGH